MRVGTLVGVQLGDPHLMLPHVGHDRAAVAGDVVDRGDDVLRRQVAAVALLPRPRVTVDLFEPGDAVARRDGREQLGHDLVRVTHDPQGRGHVLPDLRDVEVDVNDLGPRSEARRVPRDAVVEPQSDAHDEIGVLDRAVDVDLPVHPRHAEVQRV